MPNYSREAWRQLKGINAEKLIKALVKDGWERETHKGRQGKKGANTLAYRHPARPPSKNRVVIHFHPKKTMGPDLLKGLLKRIDWSEDDLRSLKLIK